MTNSPETETAEYSPETTPNQEMEPQQRTRRGRKRTVFNKAPRPAWPVRGLWESAPQAEKERAHKTCMLILEYWLGKKAKSQVATELEVTGLRVWQLSQQALSGMMAGLLTQPRTRVSAEVFERRTGETPAVLKKRIVELEKELARTEDLVRVLRTAPWANSNSDSPPKGGKSRAKKGKSNGTKKSPPRSPAANRSAAAESSPLAEGTGCTG